MIVMTKKLEQLMRELKKSSSETYFHSLRTKKYTNDLVHALNDGGVTAFSPDEIDAICKGAILHDIGKLKIKNVILTKDSNLDDDEKEAVQKHADWSYELVKDELSEEEHDIICDICKYHHERIDGSGYNQKEDLPLYVQIVSVCDVFDALCSDRVYRKGLPVKKAMSMIQNKDCGEFSDIIIEYLQKIIEDIR